MQLPDIMYTKTAPYILRITMGIIFVTHGLARLYYGSVPDFGSFLNAQGLIIGLSLAWIITVGEMICGTLMAWGRYVRFCVIFHS